MKISRILLGAAVVVAMTACGGANENKDANCETEGTEVVAAEEVSTPAEGTEATEANTEATEANTEATEANTEATTDAAAPAAETPAPEEAK